MHDVLLCFCVPPGRFDLNKSVIHCKSCNDVAPSWTLTDVVQAGYWPGSPTSTDTSYVFDQGLFQLWESLQKRMPGTSETSFIRALEDVSRMKGRVLFIAHSNSLSNVAGVWDQLFYKHTNAYESLYTFNSDCVVLFSCFISW